MSEVTKAVIGLGSNLGSREALVATAQSLLHARVGIEVLAMSPLYETEPVGPPQSMFLNAAARLETTLTPEQLLETLLRIERRLGRIRAGDTRWGPRAIDLDLLWFDGIALSTDALTVPHPHLTERSFALQPLLDVAPMLGEQYARALASLGPALTQWGHSAIAISGEPGNVTVEADSLPDALCIAATHAFRDRAPASAMNGLHSGCRATRTVTSAATPGAWAAAFNDSIQAGLRPCAVTVSHCSESQWVTSIHGEPTEMPTTSRVSVEVGRGAERTHRTTLICSR